MFIIGDKVKLKEGFSPYIKPNIGKVGTILKDNDQSSILISFEHATEYRSADDIELVTQTINVGDTFRFPTGKHTYIIDFINSDKVGYSHGNASYVTYAKGFAEKIIIVPKKEPMNPEELKQRVGYQPSNFLFDEAVSFPQSPYCRSLCDELLGIRSNLKPNKPNMSNTFEAAKVKKYLTDKRVDEIVKAEEDLASLIEQLNKASSDIDDVIEVLVEDLEELQDGQAETDIDKLKRVMAEVKDTLEYVNNFKKNTVESLAPVVTEVKRTMAEKFNR